MNRLKTKLGKLELKNPITVASGTFGVENNNFIDFNSLGAIVSKTITKNEKIGNPPPRLYETSNGLLNSIGLQNPGLKGFIENVLPKYATYETPFIVSFSGSTIDEFSEILLELEKYDSISGYEVNVSCPNVENEGIAFGTDPKIVYKLTKQLASQTDKELIIKLTPNVTDIVSIAKAAEDAGANSLALINTLLGMSIDWKSGKSHIRRGIAGYSGPAIKPVAIQNVYRVSSNVKIPILAMGGVSNWKDALEFFYAGANVVAIGTYNFVNPKITIETIDNLNRHFLSRNQNLTEIIGKINGIN